MFDDLVLGDPRTAYATDRRRYLARRVERARLTFDSKEAIEGDGEASTPDVEEHSAVGGYDDAAGEARVL